MTTLRRAGTAWILAFAVTLGTAARAEDVLDMPPPDPEPAAEQEFPWLCFAMTVVTIGTLFYLVRRLQQQGATAGPETTWYCRTCDRDVGGPKCPVCHSPNVFLEK